ncbi:MAG: hypothetical protein NC344_06885 [Bacteroidales bacterium]|nr:hypothetical protein [Bacteroidales bacterium]MCM1147542.1 hypothetical protein [Bacteroidales bacterium]MCM1206332.1 hypothetical protein [Bacillota bacterium]MCM1511240.1 hypothetical protein [Clostridium sp.]
MITLTQIIIVATVAAFLITLAEKWGIVEYMQVHGNDFFSKMFNCSFCLSWWTCVAVSVILALFTAEGSWMLAPFCSTVITRILR